MPRLAKFLKLSVPDKLLLLYCSLVVALVRIGLSMCSYRTLSRRLQKRATHVAVDDDMARRIVWAVTHSAKIIPRASCLTKAFAAQYLLARAGYQSEMRVGVARDAEGRFLAHAWLIRDGRVLMGGSDEELRRYAKLTDFSPGPP